MTRAGDTADFPAQGPPILLAEDDVTQQLLYTRILMGAGYYVICADNGDDAVMLAGREMPGLVLMDASMPGKDGWSAARELKTAPATRHIPIVLITGFSSAAENGSAEAAGCDAFLAKPGPVRELLSTVSRFLPPPSQDVVQG